MAETRKAIHAFLTPASHEAWHEFAAENGVSVSALIEALALDWAERAGTIATDGSGTDASANDGLALDDVEALARQARRIDAQRRRRSH